MFFVTFTRRQFVQLIKYILFDEADIVEQLRQCKLQLDELELYIYTLSKLLRDSLGCVD